MLPESNLTLTNDQLESLNLAKKSIPKLREQLRKAKLAGLDVSTQESELADLEQQIGKLYSVYGNRSG